MQENKEFNTEELLDPKQIYEILERQIYGIADYHDTRVVISVIDDLISCLQECVETDDPIRFTGNDIFGAAKLILICSRILDNNDAAMSIIQGLESMGETSPVALLIVTVAYLIMDHKNRGMLETAITRLKVLGANFSMLPENKPTMLQ